MLNPSDRSRTTFPPRGPIETTPHLGARCKHLQKFALALCPPHSARESPARLPPPATSSIYPCLTCPPCIRSPIASAHKHIPIQFGKSEYRNHTHTHVVQDSRPVHLVPSRSRPRMDLTSRPPSFASCRCPDAVPAPSPPARFPPVKRIPALPGHLLDRSPLPVASEPAIILNKAPSARSSAAHSAPRQSPWPKRVRSYLKSHMLSGLSCAVLIGCRVPPRK